MTYKKVKYWFNEDLAQLLKEKIQAETDDFAARQFTYGLARELEPLEIKDRVEVFADRLYRALGEDYAAGLAVLLRILGEENPAETGMFTEYYWLMPVAKYVEKYGLDDLDLSLPAIGEITKRNTGEYAIRPYLEQYPKQTLKQMRRWSQSPNFHLRRLACEGVRPRLPWAPKLARFIADPSPIVPILNQLKNDEVKFVQKSVANCLNDLTKDNYEVARRIVENWLSKEPGKNTVWIIRHALRWLRKREDDWALEVTDAL
ncbi:MAG: DNA alkylation repair protein [Bacteroidota bacterium]